MADVKPFRALRPRADLAEKIAALPYDVYSREEAYEKVRGDSYTFLRIDRPETQFAPDYDMYAPGVRLPGGEGYTHVRQRSLSWATIFSKSMLWEAFTRTTSPFPTHRSRSSRSPGRAR